MDEEGTSEKDDFKTLPSAMAMEASGDTRPGVREAAREERRDLAPKALREQAFSILWERHRTEDDGDQDRAWTSFKLGIWANAVMNAPARQRRTAEYVADGIDEMYQGFGL